MEYFDCNVSNYNTENKEGMVKYGQGSFNVASNKWSTMTAIVIPWFIPALNMDMYLAQDILYIHYMNCLILTLEIATGVPIRTLLKILKINQCIRCHYRKHLAKNN